MEKQIPQKAWFLLGLLGTIWGSAFFLMSKGLEVFSPVQMASLRMSISFVVFIPVFLFRFKEIPWKKTPFLLVVGALGSGLPALFFALAQTKLTSSITGVLGSTTPLFTLLVGMMFFAVPYFRNRVLGVLLGLTGALSIVLFGSGNLIGGQIIYAILPALATICYAFSTNTVKSKLQEVDPLTISSTAFVIIGPVMVFILLQSGFIETMQTDENAWTGFGYVAALALSSTVICSVLYFGLVQMTSAVFASMVAYLIPLVATIIGAIRGEPITIVHMIGLILILCGVYLSRK
jgi:drug/metabolite transporter (DMT)-like permease